MTFWKAALAVAMLLVGIPAGAQRVTNLPVATTVVAGDQVLAMHGSDCSTAATSCVLEKLSLAQIAGYASTDTAMRNAYQPLDVDLSNIAALSTQPFGRSRLTDPDAATARGALGLGSNATDSTARAPATRLIATAAPLTGGGDLSADRLLSIAAATSSSAGSMSASDKAKLDAISGTNTGDQTSVSGNAGTATKWATARTLSVTGDTSWSMSVDGSGNASGTSTLATVNAAPGSFGGATSVPNLTVNAKGLVTSAGATTISYLVPANNLSDVTTPGTARTNISAAASGANSDITSIAGLTTALTIAQGGTGRKTPVPAVSAYRTGSSAFVTVGQNFTTIIMNGSSIDTAAAYSPVSGIYTLPETGLYLITAKMRLADGVAAGISYGIGIDTANQDSPSFFWSTTTAGARQGIFNSRLYQGTAGDQLRLFAYVDNSSGLGVIAADLNVVRVR